MGAVRSWRRRRSDRWLAFWQHDQRCTGGISVVPNAQANLAKIPDQLTDEQVVLLADIASTGFSGTESETSLGDTVVVFAQGPIGLCSTAGAKLMGASFIIGVDSDPVRMKMSKRMGADIVLDRNSATSSRK